MIKILFVSCVLLASTLATPVKFSPFYKPRIVGGNEVEIEDRPYQVALMAYDSQICGAAIVNEDTIITAAHCSQYSLSAYSIRAGSKSQYKGGVVIPVKQVIVHPNYNSQTFDNDVALMKLAEPLKWSEQIKPVALANKGMVIVDNDTVKVSGWGDLQPGGGQYPENLREVEVPVVNQRLCDVAYGGITQRMICAGINGKDSCQGDSGGPLTYKDIHVGIVSFGIGCAYEGYPGVYARTSELREFIDRYL